MRTTKSFSLIFLLAVFSPLIQSAVQKITVMDYVEVLVASLGGVGSALSSCDCLFEGITKGSCNSFCTATNCTAIVSEMAKCAGNTTVCPSSSCAGLLGSASSLLCGAGNAGQTLFSRSICSVQASGIDYLVRSTQLKSAVRTSCSSVAVSDSSCVDACSSTSCSDYLAKVSSCVTAAGTSTCATSIAALNTEIQAGRLGCEYYNASKTSCIKSPATTFDELLPSYFKFKLGSSLATSCSSCLTSQLTNTSVCANGATACGIVSALNTLASTSCSGSACETSFASLKTFLDTNALECSSNYSASICTAMVAAVKGGASVPELIPLPSATPTVTISPSRSNTPTISVTPTNTPTNSVTPSDSPTISVTPTVTPSKSSSSGIAVAWVLVISLITLLGSF